jgi:glutamate racemase
MFAVMKPIGVFDSGYGGLTVLKEVIEQLPDYDYVYLGDNARTPYGTRSFETVYEYTLQAVKTLFDMGCELVIIACNTASAKALRTIQQKDLQHLGSEKTCSRCNTSECGRNRSRFKNTSCRYFGNSRDD